MSTAKKQAAKHTCGACGKIDLFGAGWRWPNVDVDRGYFDERLKNPVCSDACEAQLLGKDSATVSEGHGNQQDAGTPAAAEPALLPSEAPKKRKPRKTKKEKTNGDDGRGAAAIGDPDAGRGAVADQRPGDSDGVLARVGQSEGMPRESARTVDGEAGDRVSGSEQPNVETYEDFLARKALVDVPTGIDVVPPLSARLKEHQRLLVDWALRRGRAAIFADAGLGKGWMLLEWCRVVAAHTGKPVLLLAPLAVSQQFQREAELLGAEVTICYGPYDVKPGINITNYQKLHKFDPSVFGGVAADESSILKSLDGQTRQLLIDSFRATPFRLCATATPSPNDHTELGGHAEFLGVMSQAEMLASFFVHDGGSVQDWRLKGHARDAFWSWVCSWGAIVKMPGDLGCPDEGYALPPLRYHEHIIPAKHEDARQMGMLFAQPAEGLTEQRKARRKTLGERALKAAEIAKKINGKVLIWCELNDEQDALADALGARCVSIQGSTSDFDRIGREKIWREGDVQALITKPTLFGHGLNWQHCTHQIFVGVGNSYEQFYQAVRRSWRFGVRGGVDVHIVSSELEGRVLQNLKEKQRKADEIAEETRPYVSALVREAVQALRRETIAYQNPKSIVWPSWFRSEVAA